LELAVYYDPVRDVGVMFPVWRCRDPFKFSPGSFEPALSQLFIVQQYSRVFNTDEPRGFENIFATVRAETPNGNSKTFDLPPGT